MSTLDPDMSQKYPCVRQGLGTTSSGPILNTESSTGVAVGFSAPGTRRDVLEQRIHGPLLLRGPSPATHQLALLAMNMKAGGYGSRGVNLSHYLILASCLKREQHLVKIFLQQSLGLWRSSLAPYQKPAAGLGVTLGRGLPGK